MASSNSHNKPHFSRPELTSPIQQNPIAPSKSFTHFLCKSLLVLAFLIVLQLFSSQAPEFINLSILTKFSELLQLLFVGIAVSYGLFSRRNVEVGIETHSNIDNSLSNMSKIFNVTSIFEDGFENPCGSDEKKMVQTWNSQYFRDESAVVVANGSSVLDERSEHRSLISEDGFAIPSGFDENKVSQTWNSKYFQGESMVVVANGSYVIDEWGNPGPSIGNRPLGLPVRSLRSRIIDTDTTESIRGSRSGSGLGPLNLGEKFKENVVLPSPSPIPWRSRSGRMEMSEEFGTVTHTSFSMPLSAEESQFEPLKSNSFRSTRSFSSRTSSMSSSPNKLSPSSSVSSELSNSKMEELGRKNNSCGSSSADSPSPSTLINGKPPIIRPNSRQFSVGTSSEINVRSSFEDELTDFSKGSLKTDVKPAEESQFEPLKSHSFRSTRSLSSRTSSMSSSPNKLSPSSSVSSEFSNSKMEELGEKKDSCGSSSSVSLSLSTLIDGKPPLIRPNSRGFSVGSSSEINVRSSFEDELKDFSKGSLKTDVKPAEESQFEPLKSHSFRSTRSFSSRTSSMSSSPNKLSPSSSVSSELSNPKMEELGRKNNSCGSSSAVSPSSSTLINGKPPIIRPNSRQFSVGSSSEINVRSSFEDELKDFSKSRREPLVKASLRGKSVRTIRAGEHTAEAKKVGEIRGNRIDDKVGKTFNEVEAALMGRTGLRTGVLKKPTFSKYQKGEKQEFRENSIAESEEDPESEDDNFQVSSDEEESASTHTVNDAGSDTNEVDKKADEFIAKFREQIRLQKIASMKGSSGEWATHW